MPPTTNNQANRPASADEINLMYKQSLEAAGQSQLAFKINNGFPIIVELPETTVEILAEPPGTGPFSYLWSVVSSPNAIKIDDNDQQKATIRGLIEGRYVIYAIVTDTTTSEYGRCAVDVIVKRKEAPMPTVTADQATIQTQTDEVNLISETIPALPYEFSPYTSEPDKNNYYVTEGARVGENFFKDNLPYIATGIIAFGLGFFLAKIPVIWSKIKS